MDKETRPTRLSQLQDPIAIGRSAEIYHWLPGKVIKLFFKDIPLPDIESEYLNTCEVDHQGICGMLCYEKVSIEDRVGIVLDMVDGISLTKLPEKNPLHFFSLPRKLAALHEGLHRNETESLKEIREYAKNMLDTKPLEFLTIDERRIAEKTINALPEGTSILHMDFHPENVIVSDKSCVIIDWMTGARGNPAADVASTNFIIHDAELWPGTPKLKLIFYGIVRNFILRGYLKHYRKLSGMTMEQIDAWRLPILLLRLGLWDIESERESLREEINQLISKNGQKQ